MKRNIVKALAEASQTTLSKWAQDIDNAITGRRQELLTLEEKKKQIMPKLQEGQKAGLSLRELSRITGIDHNTLGRWLKESNKAEKKPDADTGEGQKQN
jgi:DNA-binding transcriptional ArsR family regulator